MRTRVGTLGRTGGAARLVRAVFAAFIVLSVLSVDVALGVADAKASAADEPSIKEVGQVPLYDKPDGTSGATPGSHGSDGFLLINPATRRGYQLFRPTATDTMIASFDLDTYKHIRTVTLKNIAVAGDCPQYAPCTAVGTPNSRGDFIHAVDQERGKLYIAGVTMTETINGGSMSFVRAMTVMEVDEAKFNDPTTTQGQFLRHIRIPAAQAGELVGRDLYGITFFRQGSAGKLLLLFSTPPGSASRYTHDHWLAQWDVASGNGDWAHLLQACSKATLHSGTGGWQYELAILRGKRYIYLPCQASHGVTLAVRIPIDDAGRPGEVTEQQGFALPAAYANVLADPASERLIFQTDIGGTAWWVFDGPNAAWVGSIGSTLWTGYAVGAGIDETTGRLYTLVPDHLDFESTGVEGGFGYSDARITPAPQTQFALRGFDYPGQFLMQIDPAVPGVRERRVFVRRGNNKNSTGPNYPGTVKTARPLEPFYRVIEDREPIAVEQSFGDIDRRTVGIAEKEGVTESSFSGVARGFGSRVLLVGGITGAVQSRQLDEEVFVHGTHNDSGKFGGEAILPPLVDSCYRTDREVVIGSGESSVSDIVTSANAVALSVDDSSKEDLEQPGSRCPAPATGLVPRKATDVPERVRRGLPTTTTTTTAPGATTTTLPAVTPPPIVDLPKDNREFAGQVIDQHAGRAWDQDADGEDDYTSSCTANDDGGLTRPERDAQDYKAHAVCNDAADQASSQSSAAVNPDPALPIRIADSSVQTSVRLDKEDGIVSEVVSTVRGLEVPGGHIGLIQTKATSRAKGRAGTATTTYERRFCGIDLPTLQRSGCGDPKAVATALAKVIGRYGEVRLRDPDKVLAAGTPGGYLAAVQRDRLEAFSDKFISRDSSNAVPALEIIVYNDSQNRGAGRQIFGFAAVEVSSTYAITCKYETAADGKSCLGLPGSSPSNLTLMLEDGNDQPLAGGVFKVHKDGDGDGAVSVDDAVISNGTCMTDAEGTGNCTWEGLEPGDYVISQTTAPAGYAPVEDFALDLPSGQNVEVTFTNLRAVAGVLLGLVDGDSGDPLKGGEFELYQDDGDGKASPADKLYATCTTDDAGLCELQLPAGSPAAAAAEDPTLPCFGQAADGTNGSDLKQDLTGALQGQLDGVLSDPDATNKICVAEVPLGAYVVHQKTAPADHDAAADLPVKFELPGQVALLVFSNGLTAIPGTAGSEGTPAEPGEQAREIPPVEETVLDPGSAAPEPIVHTTPITNGAGGPLRRALDRVLAAPAAAIRWLFSNPRELGLMVAVWTVIWLPCYLAERRRVLRALRDPQSPNPSIGASTA